MDVAPAELADYFRTTADIDTGPFGEVDGVRALVSAETGERYGVAFYPNVPYGPCIRAYRWAPINCLSTARREWYVAATYTHLAHASGVVRCATSDERAEGRRVFETVTAAEIDRVRRADETDLDGHLARWSADLQLSAAALSAEEGTCD